MNILLSPLFFIVFHTCSVGFNFGEYFGKKKIRSENDAREQSAALFSNNGTWLDPIKALGAAPYF